MLYSSGTTGQPKGILPELTAPAVRDRAEHRPHMKNVVRVLGRHGLPLPGAALPRGADRLVARHDPQRRHRGGDGALRRVRALRADRAVPGHPRPVRADDVRPDAEAPRGGTGRVRHVQPAAGRARRRAVSVEVKEQMIDWLGPIMTEYYAGSEGNGFCLIDSPTWLAPQGSVGKPILGEVHICADDGDELPAGEIGTVWFSGTRRFSYHNDPAKTAGVVQRPGLEHPRRHGLPRRGGIPVPGRPAHRPDPLRRGEHLPARGRGRARPAPGGRRHRRVRRARRGDGPAGARGRPARGPRQPGPPSWRPS